MQSSAVLLAQSLLFDLLVIFAVGTIMSTVATRMRIPDVVLFLLAGMLLGPSVLGVLRVPVASTFYQAILLFGASVILFHGGLLTSLRVLQRVWITVALLSTLGILVTACIVAMAVHWFFDVPFSVALLPGALLASTDPAAIVPLLHQLPLAKRLKTTIIAESAFTDATGAILTVLVYTLLYGTVRGGGDPVALTLLRLAFGGVAIGAAVGLVAAYLIRDGSSLAAHDHARFVIVVAVLAGYTCAQMAGASGFMSVFVAGLVVGNAKRFGISVHPSQHVAVQDFADKLSVPLRMLIFVLLGSEVSLQALSHALVPGLLVVAVFVLIARPLTVLTCLWPDRKVRWQWPEIIFFCWVRETGVIAVTLVGMLVSQQLPDSAAFLSITFLAVLVTLVLQASTTPLFARLLGLHDGDLGC